MKIIIAQIIGRVDDSLGINRGLIQPTVTDITTLEADVSPLFAMEITKNARLTGAGILFYRSPGKPRFSEFPGQSGYQPRSSIK